jgi:hypothetical protein
MMGSLSGELSDRDAEAQMTQLMAAGGGNIVGIGLKQLKVPPATFREMWTTDRGRKWAWRFAGRDLSYGEYINTPFLLTGAEFLHQSLMPGPIAPADDELFWKLTCDFHAAIVSRKLKTADVISLGLAWKGNDFGLGWSAVDSRVLREHPHLRAPLAYVLGHHWPREGKQKDAVRYFTIARDTSAKVDRVRTLAQAQLDRLQSK